MGGANITRQEGILLVCLPTPHVAIARMPLKAWHIEQPTRMQEFFERFLFYANFVIHTYLHDQAKESSEESSVRAQWLCISRTELRREFQIGNAIFCTSL